MSKASPLAQIRQLRRWTQDAAAARAGVSRTEISAIETGRLVPSVAVALKLAKAFGESVETLFGTASARPAVEWAWAALDNVSTDPRVWLASVNGRRLVYPVEQTAAGTVPHDGTVECLDGESLEAPADRTLVIAGCDPLVALLVRALAAEHGVRVVPLLRSSTEALELLRRGRVHLAGLHLTNADGRATNDQVVRTTLGRGYRLIHQVRWEAGIAVGPARRERTPDALLRAGVRWVNREEGSAARRSLDALLASRRRPAGYEHVVRDHRAVTATVSSGWAEAGVCVRAVAGEAQLRFITLHHEAYELCVADAQLDDPRVRALVSVLQSSSYRRWLADVPGCVSRKTGDLRSVA